MNVGAIPWEALLMEAGTMFFLLLGLGLGLIGIWELITGGSHR